jgi:hypothetical protein
MTERSGCDDRPTQDSISEGMLGPAQNIKACQVTVIYNAVKPPLFTCDGDANNIRRGVPAAIIRQSSHTPPTDLNVGPLSLYFSNFGLIPNTFSSTSLLLLWSQPIRYLCDPLASSRVPIERPISASMLAGELGIHPFPLLTSAITLSPLVIFLEKTEIHNGRIG